MSTVLSFGSIPMHSGLPCGDTPAGSSPLFERPSQPSTPQQTQEELQCQSNRNGRTLVQRISDILPDKIKAQHVARELRRWGSIRASIRRFAPFRDILANTGFELHRIGRLGSYFERKRG